MNQGLMFHERLIIKMQHLWQQVSLPVFHKVYFNFQCNYRFDIHTNVCTILCIRVSWLLETNNLFKNKFIKMLNSNGIQNLAILNSVQYTWVAPIQRLDRRRRNEGKSKHASFEDLQSKFFEARRVFNTLLFPHLLTLLGTEQILNRILHILY